MAVGGGPPLQFVYSLKPLSPAIYRRIEPRRSLLAGPLRRFVRGLHKLDGSGPAGRTAGGRRARETRRDYVCAGPRDRVLPSSSPGTRARK